MQATFLGRESSPMEFFVGTHVRSDDRQKKVQQFVDSRAQHFMVCWFSTFFFLSYYLFEFDEFIFYFQETYNIRLKERYGNDPSTHSDINPDLQLKVGSSGGPDRNQVYGLSNITAKNLQMALSVLTVICSQSIPSTQSLEFTALLDQGVQAHTNHLNEK